MFQIGLIITSLLLSFGLAYPAGAQEQAPAAAPNLRAVIKLAPEEKTDSPFRQYYKVEVSNAATNQLDPTVYEVYISPQDDGGKQQEIFTMLPRRATYHDEPDGVYGGIVYFSHGGHWRLNAFVNKYVSAIDKINDKKLRNAPPVTYTRASLDVQVEGGALESVGHEAFFGKDRRSRPSWSVIPIAMLWIHSLAAMAWGAVVAVLVLLALPSGRRLLSNRGANFFDQRLGALLRTYWWITAGVVLTGVYNLFKNVVYRTPFTPAKASQIFRLPYGKPYFLALFVKLSMYAVMLVMVLPLVREAKRRADLMSGTSPVAAGDAPTLPVTTASVADDVDPWAGGGFSRPARRSAEGGVATMAAPAEAAPTTAAEGNGVSGERFSDDEESTFTIKTAIAVMVIGVPVLFLAVTILKDLHNLAETIRYWTYWTSGS
jgi:hypothetical protein